MRCEQYRTRSSILSDDAIQEIAEQLKDKEFTFPELMAKVSKYNYKGSKEVVLSLFNTRGYLIAEDHITRLQEKKKKGTTCIKIVYKFVTDKDYEEYDEEAHKDAKRRLLATVSY